MEILSEGIVATSGLGLGCDCCPQICPPVTVNPGCTTS